MEAENQYQKIVPFIVFILALFLFFKLVRPMITILLSSLLLAYISHPIYTRILKKISNKTVSIVLSLLTVAIIVLIPFSFLVFEITQQGYYFYNSFSTKIEKGSLLGFGCTSAESKVCLLINQAERFSAERLSKYGIDTQLQKFLLIFNEKLSTFVLSIPLIIAEIFLIFIISFFILKKSNDILNQIVYLLPLRTETVQKLVEQFSNIAYTVIYAQLFVAVVQGIVGTIGFYLFGVPFPFIFGVVIAFAALIPTIGTAIIWLPVSLLLILFGYLSQDYWTLGKGIGLFVYGLLIISAIDNFLLTKIVNAKAQVNQILVIVGVIGGATMFGFVGIFIGPILLPLLITYFETFKERFT